MMTAKGFKIAAAVLAVLLLAAGCIAPNVRLFPSAHEPLKERVLSGSARGKVLVLSIKGPITDASDEGLLRVKPSPVEELAAQLNLARRDPDVKAVVLIVNSPGGTAMASDIIYHELMDFKEKTGVKLVVAMMDIAASGGYYVSLPADWIVAHPATVTGSVGVIMVRADVSGLMEKLGLKITAQTSGRNKDMGSPFRPPTGEEVKLFQDVADSMAARFIGLVKERRKLSPEAALEVSTARIFTAQRALELGLVDEIGYMDAAIKKAETLAGLPDDARIVAYRRTGYPDDTVYNTTTMDAGGKPALVNLSIPALAPANLSPGFYYLWLPGGP